MDPIPTPIRPLSGIGSVMRIVDTYPGTSDWYILERVPNAYVPYFGWTYGTYLPIINRHSVIPLDNDGKVFVPNYRIQLAMHASTGDMVSAYGWLGIENVSQSVAPTRIGFATYGVGRVALQNRHYIPLGKNVYFDSNGALDFKDGIKVVIAYAWVNRYRNELFTINGADQVAVSVAREP